MDTRYALGIVVAGLVIIGVIAGANHGSRNATGTNASSTATSTSTSTPVKPGTKPTPTPTPTTGGTQNGQASTLTLGLNQTGTASNTTLKPIKVIEDSRCPANVQCIQAGTVRISMQVTGTGAMTTQTFQLGRSLIVRGARITLTSVTPAKSTTPISDADYRFTFSVQPVTVSTSTSSPVATGGCYVGGCSSEICSDQPGAVSSCVYRSEFACYKSATCGRQSNGQCGWTQTAALEQCLATNAGKPALQQTM